MRIQILIVALLVGSALAGCVAPANIMPAGDEEPDEVALVDPVEAWDEGLPAANVGLVGEWRQGGGQEADPWGDFLAVDRGSQVNILNVSDPDDIREVGVIDDVPRVLDVKWSDDGKYLFIGDDERASQPPAGGTGPFSGGIYVYDVTDKASPEFVTYQPVGPERGPHMVTYLRTADGDELVFGANADVSIHRFDRESGTLTELARYRPNVVTEFDRSPERAQAYYYAWAHDMFAMNDPHTGKTMLYVANWDAGVRVVDVTDPASPQEVGGWNDFPDGHTGNLHTVATEWVGDAPGCREGTAEPGPDCRRITVGSVEIGFAVVGGYHYAQGTERSVMYVWDTTDPANIELLGWWENPDKEPAGRDYAPDEEITSTHNLQIECTPADGTEGSGTGGCRVYLAHYGLGVWVLDVSTPELQAAPGVLGYYLESGQNTWDVVLNDGRMFTSGAEGVLALHFATDDTGPTGITSRA